MVSCNGLVHAITRENLGTLHGIKRELFKIRLGKYGRKGTFCYFGFTTPSFQQRTAIQSVHGQLGTHFKKTPRFRPLSHFHSSPELESAWECVKAATMTSRHPSFLPSPLQIHHHHYHSLYRQGLLCGYTCEGS